MPKRTLIIITKGDVGGAQMFAYNLARGLQQEGLPVSVGFGEGDFLRVRLSAADVPVINFKYLKRTINPLANLLFALELRNFLRKEHYDVVQFNSTNALFGAIGAKLCGARTVFTFHGLSVLDDGYEAGSFLKLAYRATFAFLLQFVDASVFVSKDNLRVAQKLGLAKNASVIYNGLESRSMYFIAKSDAIRRLEQFLPIDLTGKFIIGSIGRLSSQKNYEFFINAFPKLLAEKNNSIALIIGDGPHRKQCEMLIQKNGLEKKVFLCGEMRNAASYLKAFDLFVLTSLYEGLSISLIETVFAEVPAIATDAAGNAEIIGKNYCFSSGNEKEFMDLFKKMLGGIDAKKIAGNISKKKEFSLSVMVKKYREVLGL
jgi:glycosyltransferase involved in cell wall biosynthesis